MKNGTKKLVVTASANGRVGSSLTIGILELSGYDVGPVTQAKDQNNAKGYFELNAFGKYYGEVVPELKGFMPLVKDIPSAIEEIKKHKYNFEIKMKDWFKGDNIAVKCPYYLPMYLFPDEYERTVISLRRNTKSQAKSIQKMNNKKGDFELWLSKWQTQIDKYFVNDIEIWYKDWIENPYHTYIKMCEVIKPPITLTEKEVTSFIDPKLKHY